MPTDPYLPHPTADDTEWVTVNDAAPIRTVTMTRNTIHGTLLADLLHSVESADRSGTRAVVTTGSGRVYCVGGDLSTFLDLTEQVPLDLATTAMESVGGATGLPSLTPAQRMADHLGMGAWSTRFSESGVATIAAINGATAGGGLALALLHDLRIMGRSARITAGYTALGLSPEMGSSWIVPRLIGTQNAFRLLTSSKPISADEALDMGLVSQVVDDSELLDAAQAAAASIAETPDQTVRAVKRLVRQSWESTFEQQLEREWFTLARLFSSDVSRGLIDDVASRVLRKGDKASGTG